MAHEDPTPWQPPLDGKTDIAQRMIRSERQPLQFSLRTIFIVTTGSCVAFAGLFGPPWAAVVTACSLLLAIPIALTTIAIYSSGYRRTFCIGAMFPAGAMVFSGLPNLILTFMLYRVPSFQGRALLGYDDRVRIAIAVGVATVAILASGVLAVGVRWLVEAERDFQRNRAAEREED